VVRLASLVRQAAALLSCAKGRFPLPQFAPARQQIRQPQDEGYKSAAVITLVHGLRRAHHTFKSWMICHASALLDPHDADPSPSLALVVDGAVP
jgi:hypothetical protein